jgi:hypothetical protein
MRAVRLPRALTLPLVGRVGAEGAGVGVVLAMNSLSSPPPPSPTLPHKGGGSPDAVPS